MRVKDEEQIAARRALILRAAREIMETQGLEALSIRKIAAMLQQTPGIIYHYFSSKEELMLAVVQEGYYNILRIIQQTMASEKRRQPSCVLPCMVIFAVCWRILCFIRSSCKASFLLYKSKQRFCRRICDSIEKVSLCCVPVWRKVSPVESSV